MIMPLFAHTRNWDLERLGNSPKVTELEELALNLKWPDSRASAYEHHASCPVGEGICDCKKEVHLYQPPGVPELFKRDDPCKVLTRGLDHDKISVSVGCSYYWWNNAQRMINLENFVETWQWPWRWHFCRLLCVWWPAARCGGKGSSALEPQRCCFFL